MTANVRAFRALTNNWVLLVSMQPSHLATQNIKGKFRDRNRNLSVGKDLKSKLRK